MCINIMCRYFFGRTYVLTAQDMAAYPELAPWGYEAGTKARWNGGLLWPEGCDCYVQYGGKVAYHQPTFLVLGCVSNKDC